MEYTDGQKIEHGIECPFSAVDVLAEERGTTLAHVSAGARLAGSIRAYQEAHYSVSFALDGARHGRKFREYEAARAHYDNRVNFLRGLA